MIKRHLSRYIKHLTFLIFLLISFTISLQADESLRIYYGGNAQVEIVCPDTPRVFIDVHDPQSLSSRPTANDILLTTHNHGDHRRLDFIRSFPGKQLDVRAGKINLEKVQITGIASSHYDELDFRDENGSNYIFLVVMGGLRIAHFGDIGQKALTTEQLKTLGKIDIAISQLVNRYSDMTLANKKGFNLMDQLDPKLIIPTHIFNPTAVQVAADKWEGYNAYKKYLTVATYSLPETTSIVFMGSNANVTKLPYSEW